MKLGVLYSGGKDSTLALIKSKEFHEISCLITIIPENKDSFLFHTSNIELVKYQAEAMDIPIYLKYTKGEKEKEVKDLLEAIKFCKREFGIEGVVSGAIRSIYQASRIQKVCKKLNIFSFNPIWLINPMEEINEIEKYRIKAIITSVSSFPLDESFLGKEINRETFEKMSKMKIDVSGEGGEYETFVLDSIIFKKRIVIKEFEKFFDKEKYFGYLKINKVELC